MKKVSTRFLTLKDLARMRKQWDSPFSKATAEQKAEAISQIDKVIEQRSKGVRCALPKKKQRLAGFIPSVEHEKAISEGRA
jgi:hypothetical protein